MESKTQRWVVIGVDIGGTKIAGRLADGQGWASEPIQVATPAKDGTRAVLDAVVDLCKKLMQQAEQINVRVNAIGVGAAGQIDPNTGVVLDANNLTGWTNTPIQARLHEALNLPVYVDNDVNVMALGEGVLGAGADYKHILYVAVGTGIGGAIVQHGKIWHGARFSAGEIGYLVAARDEETILTLEQLAAGPALERAYWILTGGNNWHALKEIATFAKNGDVQACQVIERGAFLLGSTLAPALALLDPEVLIVGGGVAQIGEMWWHPFIQALRDIPLTSTRAIPVVKAMLGTSAVQIGAAVMATQRLHADRQK